MRGRRGQWQWGGAPAFRGYALVIALIAVIAGALGCEPRSRDHRELETRESPRANLPDQSMPADGEGVEINVETGRPVGGEEDQPGRQDHRLPQAAGGSGIT